MSKLSIAFVDCTLSYCSYLLSYAFQIPGDIRDAPPLFPVLVYIHGDSYVWGAGSLYDGTVLSSYGELVVVTLNYRLGILGKYLTFRSPHKIKKLP